MAYPNRPRYCHYGQTYIFPRRNDCPAGTRRTCSCCFLPADAAPRKSSSGGNVAGAGCFRGTTLRSFFQLMESWEDNTAQQLFSSNVFQDYTRDEIRQKVEDLYHQQVSVDRWLSRTEVILQSRNSNRRIQILFNPLGEIQKLT